MKNKYCEILLKLAKKAYFKNEVPISALIVCGGKVISKYYNQKNIKQNALYHAEIMCIHKACKKLKKWNLSDCEMYITLEPCNMCKNAIQEARIKKVYYIVSKGNTYSYYDKTKYEQMYVQNDKTYINLLKTFFKQIRK